MKLSPSKTSGEKICLKVHWFFSSQKAAYIHSCACICVRTGALGPTQSAGMQHRAAPLPGDACRCAVHASRVLETTLLSESSELQDPPLPLLPSLHPSTYPHLSCPSLPPSFVFSLLPFSHSPSGRATRGGPSQPSPEPAGSRGSGGCASE